MEELLSWIRHWFRRPQIEPAVPVGIAFPDRRPPGFELPELPTPIGIMRERRRLLAESLGRRLYDDSSNDAPRPRWRPGLVTPGPRDRGNHG